MTTITTQNNPKSIQYSVGTASSSVDVIKSTSPSPFHLDMFLPWACKQMAFSESVFIKKKIKEEIPLMIRKVSTASRQSKASKSPASPQKESKLSDERTCLDKNAIIITIAYNIDDSITDVCITKSPNPIPRRLIQLLSLVSKFHRNWSNFTVSRGLDCLAVYEISKMLTNSNLTQIILDGSEVAEGNYDILLQNQSNLSFLSLSRCLINDEVCCKIAYKLIGGQHGNASLKTLNLSSNNIGNVGAKALGNMLRKNRVLRFLNLSDNEISDEGAIHLIISLNRFLLNSDEIMEMRKKIMTNALEKIQKEKKHEEESETPVASVIKEEVKCEKPSHAKMNKKKKSASRMILTEHKETQVSQIAIVNKEEELIEGKYYCFGNFTLSYLNVGYNDLSYFFLVELLKVLKYQKLANKEGGLYRVIIAGNNMPLWCTELADIDALLKENLGDVDFKVPISKSSLRSQSRDMSKVKSKSKVKVLDFINERRIRTVDW